MGLLATMGKEGMSKKISLKRALGIGTKDTIAIGLITYGVTYISGGDYIVGGAFVAVGWVLLVAQEFI